MEGKPYPIQIEPTARYLLFAHMFALVFPLGLVFGLGFALALVYALTWGRTLPRRQAMAQSLRVEGETLRVDSGVYFLKRTSIPLDRVTDVMLHQGPVQRRCGIWALKVQTAGDNAEATVYGLENPEQVREALMSARDEAVRRKAG